MCSREVISLSLLILLSCCQVEALIVQNTSKGVIDYLDALKPIEVKNTVATDRTLLSSQADSPLSSIDGIDTREDEFALSIEREISLCIRNRSEASCSWRRGFTIVNTIMTHTVRISLSTCCCACRNTDVCDAVHYESSGGGQCVFHQGKATSVHERGTRRWIKR